MGLRRRIAVLTGAWNGEVLYELLSGISQACSENNADTFVFSCYGGWSEDPIYNIGEYNIFSLMNTDDYDGFIIISRTIASYPIREQLRKKIVASGKPAISIEHDLEGIHYVGINNYEAMYHMVEHLIVHHQCRVLNYAGGPEDDYENLERMRAFRDVLAKYDIHVEERRIRNFGYKYSDGIDAFRHFNKIEIASPDAVVCANDELAVGYCCEASRNGLKAPNDFLITGFDNFRFAETFVPKLTTVDREKELCGYHSCSILFSLIEGDDVPHRTMLKSYGIFAQSCGCDNNTSAHVQLSRDIVIENILKNEAVKLRLNSMEKTLVKCENFHDYYFQLQNYIPLLETPAFYILINESEQKAMLSSNTTSPSRGYDPLMYVAIAYENGHVCDMTGPVPSAGILPVVPDDSACHMYLISPLHFQDHCVGYSIVVDSLLMLRQNVYYDWLNSINLSMEAVREKQLMAFLNDKLNTLYMEDSLTGLYNRFGYSVKAEKVFSSDNSSGLKTMVMFMDLNGLKLINDTFGHEHGDLALRTLGNVIKNNAPRDAALVRFGGDEFLIVSPITEHSEADRLKQSLESSLDAYNSTSKIPYEISASIGYVITDPLAGITLDEYVKQADKMMYIENSRYKEIGGTINDI